MSKAIANSNQFMEKLIDDCKKNLSNAKTGGERIRLVQKHAGAMFFQCATNILPYVAAGIASFKIIENLSSRWLGDTQNADQLNKALSGNVTSEMGFMIGDLADRAREYPEVVEYLRSASNTTFYDGLHKVSGGQAFSQAFRQFIDKYGMRCSGEIDITRPRWQDEPTLLLAAIISNIQSVTRGEHRRKQVQGLAEADYAAQTLIARVKGTTGGFIKAKLMSHLISVYRNVMGLREHPKYIFIRHFNLFKPVILAEGHKLTAQGVLKQAEDVFYLSLDEILAVVEKRFVGNLDRLIALRKDDFNRYQSLTPPRLMTSDGEVITARIQDANHIEGALIGTPVSSGVVEGYARVVLRPEEANLQKGEILIAPFTDTGWTPLFISAKALVMEIGGLMTHGAVVAREYGIPAVAGIDDATKKIKDGQYIRVDGTQGYVLILDGEKNVK